MNQGLQSGPSMILVSRAVLWPVDPFKIKSSQMKYQPDGLIAAPPDKLYEYIFLA